MVFATVAEPEVYWLWDLLGLLSIPALVALNALFVAAEFALVAVRRTRIEEMVQQGVKGAKTVQSALHKLDRSIAATQLGVTLASIGLGWAGEPMLARFLLPWFAFLGGGSRLAAHTLATVMAFFLITYLEVVFGELLPKNVAIQSPDRTALWLAMPLRVFSRLTRPLILLMTGSANVILRLLGFQPGSGEGTVHSPEELSLLIEDTEEAGLLEEYQAEFVQNVFHLSDKKVADCMVSADKMATLELNAPPDRVMEQVRHGAHTRMPVYEGELDNIVGVVNTKDLFYLFSLKGVVVLEDALYPALFLKPNETVATALKLLKQSRRHMALVRDENGKIRGLLTLEDVLEEIVGDIEDEHDRPTPKLTLRMRRPVSRPAAPPRPAAPKK
jgi:CBS domain containing-hemolysin-like protein